MNCSCILPAYNEAPRIRRVLNVLTKSEVIEKIIVVNDGSTDETLQIVKKYFPQLETISLPHNRGKAAAVKKGLAKINTSHVLLFDADLKNAKVSEIDQAINLMVQKPELDMIILRRLYEVKNLLKNLAPHLKNINLNGQKLNQFIKNNTLNKISCLLSGERILKTELLREIFKTEINNYDLEIAINQYCFDHHKNVCWMPSSALNNAKIKELGFSQFLNKYISMHLNVMSFVGMKQYMQQINGFCNDECKIET